MDNLKIYSLARQVPQEAVKTIQAGRLKGMSDINPMYRIKRLTEMFGPCGIGWWYEIVDKHLTADEITKQVAAFVDILLYYVDPESGATSHGIPGTGGASFVSQERNGPYMSDECYKMALTDAISVAAKALGIGADVYWEKDRTKYSGEGPGSPPPSQNYTYHCQDCQAKIENYVSPVNGKVVTAEKHVNGTLERFGKVLCPACVEREQKIRRVEEYAAKMAAGEGE